MRRYIFRFRAFFVALRIGFTPLLLMYFVLLCVHNPIKRYFKQKASEIYVVRDERSYVDRDEYLTVVERQKLIGELPFWLILLFAYGGTFFFIVRPRLLYITQKFDTSEQLDFAKKHGLWKSIYPEVRSIFNEWDPLGVVDHNVLDEYDTYVSQITSKLIHKKTNEEIKNFLSYVFVALMACDIKDEELEKFSNRFVALVKDLELNKPDA